jgi:hypothetical protein
MIDPTWRSNSWGTLLGTGTPGVLTATFENPWAALSLYSTGFDLKDTRSITIDFAVPRATATPLYLALYQGKNRLGSVLLDRYITATGTQARIPLSDLDLLANYATDLVIESEFPASIDIKNIVFSPASAESRKSAPPVEEGASAQEPVSTPLPPISEPIVYFGGTQNGWIVTSRRATMELENEDRSVTGKAIKVSFDTTTSALTFYQPRAFSTAGYDFLRIRVYGGITENQWQQLYLSAYNAAGKRLGTSDIAAFSGRGRIANQTWNVFEIPLSALGAKGEEIATLELENASITQQGDALWIDDISFGTN